MQQGAFGVVNVYPVSYPVERPALPDGMCQYLALLVVPCYHLSGTVAL